VKEEVNMKEEVKEEVNMKEEVKEEVNMKEEVKKEVKEEVNVKDDMLSIKLKKYEEVQLIKMKVDDLRNLCIQESVSIKKVSEKSGKDIFKLKDELIKDLLLIV
jgi:hypothetical protein